MTICIAVLADNGKSLVLASDKEVTYGFPINTEVESEGKKIQKINEKIFILLAGNSFICMELIEEVRKEKQGANNVREVADALCTRYVEARQKRMAELYILPRGLTLERYLKEQKELNQQIVLMIDNGMMQDNQSFNATFIVAGLDESGAHIYGIFHPGLMSLMDISGFCAIGIGDVHAINSLIGNRYSSTYSLREALYFVFEAKKRSEAAPGVGQLTDIVAVTTEGIHELTNSEIEELSKIEDNLRKKLKKELEKELESYKLGGKLKDRNNNGSKST